MTKHEAQSESASLAAVMRQCRESVIQRLPEITQAIIDKAVEGSHQHAKFLFELVDSAAVQADADKNSVPGPSLAQILLDRLDIVESESAAQCLAEYNAKA